jgi:hypothetical protein
MGTHHCRVVGGILYQSINQPIVVVVRTTVSGHKLQLRRGIDIFDIISVIFVVNIHQEEKIAGLDDCGAIVPTVLERLDDRNLSRPVVSQRHRPTTRS